MGILDFAKEGASNQLQEMLIKQVSEKFSIENLDIDLTENKVVKVGGTVESDDIKDKVVEMIKGIDGVEGVLSSLKVIPKVEGSEVNESGETVYTVKSGDTLWGISEKFYGDGSKYMQIFEANKEVWKNYNDDPNIIYPDWKLVIPPKA